MNVVKKLGKLMLCLIFSLAIAATMIPGMFDFTAYAAAGDPPGHDKSAEDNGDGTYKLELSVTGDADNETQEAGKVNVLVVYDTSSSMTSNAQGINYTRADQAEDVVHDFLTNLATYQNDIKDNINVALVTFARFTDQHNQGQGWTTNVTGLANRFDDGGTDRQTSMSYSGTQSNGTNWEAALDKANDFVGSAPGNGEIPTFVIMMTDGACTASGNGNNAIAPQGASIAQLRNFYSAATDDALDVARACEATGGTFYGIYAYGTEADLLDDLMYYSENGQHRGGNINNVVAATQDAPNFFLAANTDALNDAIDEIFDKVVQAMGISSVSISDGTTNQVTTSTGVAELLEVDESSYQYWLSIPVVNNQFERVDRDGNTITYTVRDNGDGTCTVTWGSNSVTVDGSVSGGQFKYEWTEANALYNYAPPEAKFNKPSVDWDLSSVGTLLDGVTYSVTFDAYPSQTTLDIVADIKNDPGEDGAWGKLDPAIQQYINKDGELSTNTTATLSYVDTRTGNAGEETYENPDPVPSQAVEQMAITKEWENEIDQREHPPVTLTVTRDGIDAYKVTLGPNSDPAWTDSVFISVGIMRTNEEGKMEVLEGSEGHDFTFTEPEDLSYHWELDVPVVHPMLIDGGKNNNGKPNMLIKVDEKHPLPDGATSYTIKGNEYYIDDEAVALTATNERRSRLYLTKAVEGENVPADAEFPFTINVVNSKAPEEEDPNLDSDYWVWISARDKDGNAIEGITGATRDGTGSWWYAPSGTDVTIPATAGCSIMVNNLPTGTTYTIKEGELPTGFVFNKAELSIEGDGTDSTFSGGQTTTGTIESTNSEYTVTYTNEYALATVIVKKVWNDKNDADGLRPAQSTAKSLLTLNADGSPVSNEPDVTFDGNTWTYKWTGLPKYKTEGEQQTQIKYTVTEDSVPAGYEVSGSPASSGGTITNTHKVPEPGTIQLVGKKVLEGWTGDLPTDVFKFTIAEAPVDEPAEEPSGEENQSSDNQSNDANTDNVDDTQDASNEQASSEEQQAADDAQKAADEAQAEADEAKADALEAQALADTAIEQGDDAEEAVKAAAEAQEAAEEAQEAADDAQDAADEAQAEADEAKDEVVQTEENVQNAVETVEETVPEVVALAIPLPTPDTVTNDKYGNIEFGTITYTKAGTYKYAITESGEMEGVEFDTETKYVTVEVTEEDGALIAKVIDPKEGVHFTFTNKYTAPPVDPGTDYIDPPVTKVIKGDAPSKAETYTFKLEAQDPSNPMPKAANGQSSMTMNITGEGTKEFGEIYFTKEHAGADGAAKAYDYTVTEVAGDNADCEYDSTVYAVRAYVSIGDDGKLKVKREYYKNGVQIDTAKFEFINTYETEEEEGNGTKTGDDNNLMTPLILLIMSGLGIAAAIRFRRHEDEML